MSACFLITVSVGVAADRYGTAVEARSMLERAISAVKDNKEAALASFTAGVKGFKDRDLYVFCHGPDGLVSATGKDPLFDGRSAHVGRHGNLAIRAAIRKYRPRVVRRPRTATADRMA